MAGGSLLLGGKHLSVKLGLYPESRVSLAHGSSRYSIQLTPPSREGQVR